MPARQLPHACVDASWCRDVAVGEVFLEREARDLSRTTRMLAKRRQFAREAKSVAFMEVIERLLAEAITADEEPLAGTIIQGERPHPIQLLDKRIAPMHVPVQQHLGVAVVRLKHASRSLQFRPEFRVVIYLFVEDDADLAIGRPHRLHAAGKVDDAQAAVAEKHSPVPIDPMSLCVGSTMPNRIRHPLQVGAFTRANEARYSAHAAGTFGLSSGDTLRVARTRYTGLPWLS